MVNKATPPPNTPHLALLPLRSLSPPTNDSHDSQTAPRPPRRRQRMCREPWVRSGGKEEGGLTFEQPVNDRVKIDLRSRVGHSSGFERSSLTFLWA